MGNAERVFLIVDRNFGDRAGDIAQLGPIWMVKSGTNEAVAKRLWQTPNLPADHVTVFDSKKMSAEDLCIGQLDNIDQHHPVWNSIEVIGAHPTERIRSALKEYGPGDYDLHPEGFVFHRSGNRS